MSLDGVVDSPAAAPHKWMVPEMGEEMAAGIGQADAVLLGPKTYRLFTGWWAQQSDDIPMARFLNHSPKYVATHSPEQMGTLEWQPAHILTGDLATALGTLKAEPGKNIQVPGSPRLVRSLLREGLLDELSLNICPVIVGSGMRLFDEMPSQVNLTLAHSTTFRNGVLGLTYQPVGS